MRPLALHVLCRRIFLFGKRLPQSSQTLHSVTPPRVVDEVIATFSARCSIAELSASKYGNLYRSAYWAIYLMSSVAVGMALLTMALPDFGSWFVVLETLTILSILAIFVLGSRQKWHAQWLAFRKEAEVIRYLPVVHITSLLSSHPAKEADQGFESQHETLRDASYEVPIDISAQEKECLKRLDQLLRDGDELNQDFLSWVRFIIREQIRYHEKRAFEEHIIHERIHKLAFFCFVITAFAVMAHSAIHTVWLSVFAAFFPSLAAALTGVAAHAEMVRLKLESEAIVKDLSEIEQLISDPLATHATVKDCLERFVERVLGEVIIWHKFAQQKALTLA